MEQPVPDPVRAGQQSVWSFPRPAIAEPEPSRLRVVFAGQVIAETCTGYRTLETSHPPTYYFPPSDVRAECLHRTIHTSSCEWKGRAAYFDIVLAEHTAARAAWSYPQPTSPFAAIKDFFAFYPAMMDACFVDDEMARPQPGEFYGGWVTSQVAGPFKGEPGSSGW